MLRFQRCHHARRVVAGIELAAKIRKDQYDLSGLSGQPLASHAQKWRAVLAA